MASTPRESRGPDRDNPDSAGEVPRSAEIVGDNSKVGPSAPSVAESEIEDFAPEPLTMI
jgi:hypothetical protein